MQTPNSKANMAACLPCNSKLSDDNSGAFHTPSLSHYSVLQSSIQKLPRSLVNRGANGGIGGLDVPWIDGLSPLIHIIVTGIGNPGINNIKVVLLVVSSRHT